MAGEVEDLLAGHRVLTGPSSETDDHMQRMSVVNCRRAGAQAHLLVRTTNVSGSSAPGTRTTTTSASRNSFSHTCANLPRRHCPARPRCECSHGAVSSGPGAQP